MATINVDVNGKAYNLACADGEQDRLQELVAYINAKADYLTGQLGHVSENKLLLMVAVLIADELHEALEGKGEQGLIGALSKDDLAIILNQIAGDVEDIADNLGAH